MHTFLKKIIGISFIFIFTLSIGTPSVMAALNKTQAIAEYSYTLQAMGMEQGPADVLANTAIDNLIAGMNANKEEAKSAVEFLKERVQNLPRNDSRKDKAEEALSDAEDAVSAFYGMASDTNLQVLGGISGVAPQAVPSEEFTAAEAAALSAMSTVNRLILAPFKPTNVPEGDLVNDFIPQLVRQFYRFSWVVSLIALTVSGIILVMVQSNEERITKAKEIFYYVLVGFAFIAFSFAIVKGFTNIDFFRFI